MNTILLQSFATCFILFCQVTANAQSLPAGQYIGYEKLTYCSNEATIVHDTVNKDQKIGWHFKVILNVNYLKQYSIAGSSFFVQDTSLTIEKLPIYFPTSCDSLPYVDFRKGHFYYEFQEKDNKNGSYISGWVIDCKYCKIPATAVPIWANVFYNFRRYRENLLLDKECEKNILFEKVK